MSDLPLILEPAADDDAEPIERLNERVFGPGRFARAAYRIRETTPADPGLSFVARVGTLLVGASAMTPIAIGGAPALLLGPLIVVGFGGVLVELLHRRSAGETVARGGEGGRLEARHPGGR